MAEVSPKTPITRTDREWLREAAAILGGKQASAGVRRKARQQLEALAYRADMAERKSQPDPPLEEYRPARGDDPDHIFSDEQGNDR